MKWIEAISPKQAHDELGAYQLSGWMKEMDRCWRDENNEYCVMSRLLRTPLGKVEHVTITATPHDENGNSINLLSDDGSRDIPWAVKQQIKNELFGEKRVAIEVYPKSKNLVDVADVYHLWVFDKDFDMPFGIGKKDPKCPVVNRGSTRVRGVDESGNEYSLKDLLSLRGGAFE